MHRSYIPPCVYDIRTKDSQGALSFFQFSLLYMNIMLFFLLGYVIKLGALQIYTAKLLLLFNTGVYGAIVLSTFFLSKGHRRAKIVGWVCAAFSLCVFAAPLSIMVLPNYTSITFNICFITQIYGFFFIHPPMSDSQFSSGLQRLVIRTKSVEYMPFPLSFFLTICAVMWFFYGLLIRDFYIAVSNQSPQDYFHLPKIYS